MPGVGGGKLASPIPPTGASDVTKWTAISGERHYAAIGKKALLDHTAPNGYLSSASAVLIA
jgi:hypothetical protein